ncbi:MAG: hypothetical protein K0Q97_1760 [Bacillota bacterium]|jgi:DNA-binding transcriptional regulator YhcF (GntR family)|nr:hypothetical protein [Bacillota bacterium]
MDIKGRLKEFDIKIGEFANKLKITRPTLDKYIEQFENEGVVANNKYQFVFESLFSKHTKSKEEFKADLERFHYLLERDEFIGAINLDVNRTDLMTSVIKRIRDDLSQDGYNEGVYRFINMLVTNYREDDVFLDFTDYFLYLNGVLNIETIEENKKAFLSNCYRLMHCDKCCNLETDEKYFNMFVTRIREIKEKKEQIAKQKAEDAFKAKYQEKINSRVQEQLKMGLTAEAIDYDELIESINLSDD